VGIERKAHRSAPQEPRQGCFARLERLPAQILAVELEEIERAEQGDVVVALAAQELASPSMTKLRALTAVIAATAAGNRSVKSVPRRLNSLTFSPARVAMTRKPSCLISCTQPAPA
jgi:hypothetical protein